MRKDLEEKIKERLGEEKYNNQGLLMKIVEYKNAHCIIVEFQDERKYRKQCTYNQFLIGSVYNPYYLKPKGNKKICSKCKKEKPLNEFTYRNDKETYVSYCKQCANKKAKEYVQNKKETIDIKRFVYKLLDENYNVLYVGKTWDLKRRIHQHMNPNSSMFSKEDINKIKYVGYLFLKSEIQSDLREIYYINEYRPPFNKQYNYEYEDRDVGIELRELEWTIINIKDLENIIITDIEVSKCMKK